MINRRKFVSSLLGIFSTPTVTLIKPSSTAIKTVVETDEGTMEQLAAEIKLGMALQSEGINPNPAISSMRQLGGVVQQVESILSKIPTVPVEEDTGGSELPSNFCDSRRRQEDRSRMLDSIVAGFRQLEEARALRRLNQEEEPPLSPYHAWVMSCHLQHQKIAERRSKGSEHFDPLSPNHKSNYPDPFDS